MKNNNKLNDILHAYAASIVSYQLYNDTNKK